jgi:hypothetical protein
MSPILDAFSDVKIRYGGLDVQKTWRPPVDEINNALAFAGRAYEELDASSWVRSAGSYTSLYEAFLQYFAVCVLTDLHPAIKTRSLPSPENVCVRFVRSPRFIVEHVARDPFHYIVVSDPTFTIPFHIGLCQKLLAGASGNPISPNRVQTNIWGGRDAETTIYDYNDRADNLLGALGGSVMSTVLGKYHFCPPGKEPDLDRENQQMFVETFIRLFRSGGMSPFEHGIESAASYFSAAFLMYAIAHEIGHIVLGHGSGLRDLGEELGCDLVACTAMERLFPSYAMSVPIALAAGAVFYASLTQLAYMTEMVAYVTKDSDGVSRHYTPLEGKVSSESFDRIGVREFVLTEGRSIGTAAFMMEHLGKFGDRNDIGLYWSLLSELKIMLANTIGIEQLMPGGRDINAGFRESAEHWRTAHIENSAKLYLARQSARDG